MVKKGMSRPALKDYPGEKKRHIPKNDVPPVPEIQGKAKTGNKKAGNP